MQTGGFVGGNHLYNSTIKTAKTESYSISVDNKIINANEAGYADNIVINVINTIYDPAIAPAPEATILSTPLSTETVSYVINKNTIEVGVTQSFSKTTTNKFSYYYGMQSMFVDENYVIAPGTQQYYDWTLVDNSTQLISRKNETTNFNRFIEKSTTKQTYQSSYLNTAFGLGKRTNTLDTNIIFSRSYAKIYHTVLAVPIDIAGKTLQWNGSYTFFKVPLLDSEFILAYQGTIRGKDAIFINSKKAFNGSIPVPSELALKRIQIIENNGFVNEEGLTTFELGGNGIYVSCASNASIIILFI